MISDDGILIQSVVVVEPSPGGLHLNNNDNNNNNNNKFAYNLGPQGFFRALCVQRNAFKKGFSLTFSSEKAGAR
jgi:hypothetical protein